jgi:hypothetical protein
MPARDPADYEEMRFEKGRISAKTRNAAVLTRIWQKHATGGADWSINFSPSEGGWSSLKSENGGFAPT